MEAATDGRSYLSQFWKHLRASAMTDKDVETLCGVLNQLQWEQLAYLDTVGLKWFPRVTTIHVREVLDAIRCCLLSLPYRRERLKRVAVLYCWLVPLNILRPWTLYRINNPAKVLDPFDVFGDLQRHLQPEDHADTCGYAEDGNSMYFSIPITEDGFTTVEHRIVCVCMWRHLPVLAVHAPGAIFHKEYFMAALAAVLVDPEKHVLGYYGDFDSAHSQAMKTLVA